MYDDTVLSTVRKTLSREIRVRGKITNSLKICATFLNNMAGNFLVESTQIQSR